MTGYVDTYTASQLTGEHERRMREKVESGTYEVVLQTGKRGGTSGESYLIAVSSLPIDAQILHAQMIGDIPAPAVQPCDLAGYRERYGEDGLQELQRKQKAAQAGLAIRAANRSDILDRLRDVANEEKITPRTLYRWMDAYEQMGLAGLMKPVSRADKGKTYSMCPAARQFAYRLFADKVKRTTATIFRQLCREAETLGANACERCIYHCGTDARWVLEEAGEAAYYPPCDDPVKAGMRVPESRQTLSRILSTIPDDEKTLARQGVAEWKNKHMVMGTREKPTEVNHVWYGDHHQFDCFVLDENGKAVRPWITIWYDAATGCAVGWVLCTNPNTDTITEAFARAVAHTGITPFYGLPVALYIDNGKDYRSKVFEGSAKTYDLGYLNANIAQSSVIQLFGVQVHHAIAYNAWSKTVERFFGTLESIWIREVPGWCGNSPSDRPEDHMKDLKRLQERGELWTMDEFYTYLQDEVFPDYHERPHEGHGGKTPIELYNTLPRARDDVPAPEMLAIARMRMATRTVQQIGIRFANRLYWDDALIGLAGRTVTIRYSESDASTVTVLLDNRSLCEAHIKHNLQVVDEDRDVLASHMARQKGQLHDVRERVRRASRSVFYEEYDEGRAAGNISALEYRKAEKMRKAKRKQIEGENRRSRNDPARDMLLELGSRVLNEG